MMKVLLNYQPITLSKEPIIIDQQIKPSNEKRTEEKSVPKLEDEKEQRKQHIDQYDDNKKAVTIIVVVLKV